MFSRTFTYSNFSLPVGCSTLYPYGFNGKENDNSIASTGDGAQDFGERIYNPALGRFLSVDPLVKSFAFNSPYLFAGNSPVQAIDKDGEKIYFVNANGEIAEATRALLRTMSGGALIRKFFKSKTHDIYIAVSDNFTSTYKDLSDKNRAVALTVENANVYVKSGKVQGISKSYKDASDRAAKNGDIGLAGDQEEASNAFKVFEGLDVSKSEGRKISFIVFDNTYMKNGNTDANAESIFHELYSHIELAEEGITDTDLQHEIYGNRYYNKPATPGSPSDQIKKEIKRSKVAPKKAGTNK